MFRKTRLELTGSLSLFRLLASVAFATVAFQRVPLLYIAVLYLAAMASDLVDGYVARRLGAQSYFGTIIDLISDKSLSIVSVLYAAERGVSLLPLALIATREVVSLGMRAVVVDGKPVFQSSRALGGLFALVLWSDTLVLVTLPADSGLLEAVTATYWAVAIAMMLNLSWRTWNNVDRIKRSLGWDE